MPRNQITMSQMRTAMAEGAGLLKSASARIAALEQELYQYKMRDYATKLASQMRDKNLSPSWGSTQDEVVHHLMTMPRDKLAAVAQAVEMAAPHDPFARLDQTASFGSSNAGRGGSAFEQYVMGLID